MIKRTFTVYDAKAEAYLDTFNRTTVGLAKREFGQAANNPESNFCKFPHDYTLIECGTWDDATGLHTPEPHIEHGTAASYQESNPNELQAVS